MNKIIDKGTLLYAKTNDKTFKSNIVLRGPQIF